MAGEPITLYDGGRLRRDFTYIDDIVAGVVGCLDHHRGDAVVRVLNIDNNRSESGQTRCPAAGVGAGRRAIVREAAVAADRCGGDVRPVHVIGALTGSPRTAGGGDPRFAAWFKGVERDAHRSAKALDRGSGGA